MQIRIEAYDQGLPTSLSSDLDLTTTRSAPISICSVALGEIFRLEMDKIDQVL